MAKILHTCTGCVPIDVSIIDTYVALTKMVDLHKGDKGDKGDVGMTPNITIGAVTTVEPGTPASATITGTPEAPILNLALPKGMVGATPNLTIGTVTTGQPGTQAIVTITGTAAAPVLNIQIPQGLQGNSGYSGAAGELEVVNNDTDGGATAAYSAERGKALRKDLTTSDNKATATFNDYMAKENIDPTACYKFDYNISPDTGNWGSSTTYKHSIISVIPGDVIYATANSSNVCRVCFLKSHDVTSGDPADFSSATPALVTVAAGTTTVFVVPLDAKYFYFYQGTASSYSYCLASLVRYTAPFYKDVVNLSDYKVWPFSLGSGTTFLSNGNDKYTLIPCSPGDKIRITANNTANAHYAWFTEYIIADSGATAPLVEGTTRATISAGTFDDVVAPETASFLYLTVYYRDGTNRLPASVYKPASNEERIEGDESKLESAATINLSNLPLKNGYINADGVWKGTGSFRHIIVPCESGETYRVTGTTRETHYAFLSAYSSPVTADQSASFVEGTTRYSALGKDVRFTTPAGTKYLYFYGGDARISSSSGRMHIPCVLEKVSDIASLAAAQAIMRNEMNEVKVSNDIVSLNPPSEFIPKFMSATKRYYTSTNTDRPYPLVFLHLSDIHSNWDNVGRYLEFAGKYEDYIDELVNTGDTVLGLYSDGVDGYNAIDGVEDILTIIGNHETREGDDWQAHTGVDAYNLVIAPHVSSWGVTQPENAATNGYCYYYKDYAAKNIRAIFVDIMGYDETEDAWLSGVLASARTSGYHVVILTHFSGSRPYAERDEAAFTKIACNYTTLYGMGSSATNLYGYNAKAYMMNDTVDGFMTDGGHFIGFIQGHYHADFIAAVAKYPGQLIYSIGASKAGEMRDYNHVAGTRMQDEFQIVAIDTVSTIVKLFKVGANIDRYGRSKSSVCVNYTTGVVLGEGF